MLAGMKGPLDPPNVPFASSANSQASYSRSGSPSGKNAVDASSVSLTVNYLPSKFSNSLLTPGARRRKGGKGDPVMPKRGGGVEAFKSGESRMAGQNDEDYDGVSGGLFGGDGHKKLRWNKFKWILFVANCFVSFARYSLSNATLTTVHSLRYIPSSLSFFVSSPGSIFGQMLTSSGSATVLSLLFQRWRPALGSLPHSSDGQAFSSTTAASLPSIHSSYGSLLSSLSCRVTLLTSVGRSTSRAR